MEREGLRAAGLRPEALPLAGLPEGGGLLLGRSGCGGGFEVAFDVERVGYDVSSDEASHAVILEVGTGRRVSGLIGGRVFARLDLKYIADAVAVGVIVATPSASQAVGEPEPLDGVVDAVGVRVLPWDRFEGVLPHHELYHAADPVAREVLQ